jgi:hypothetical protein
MSIYNKTFDVDEEITSDSLNQISADANNSLENIHPQYMKQLVDGSNVLLVVSGNNLTYYCYPVSFGSSQFINFNSLGTTITFSADSDLRLARVSFIKGIETQAIIECIGARWTGSQGGVREITAYYDEDGVETVISTGNIQTLTGAYAKLSLATVDISSIPAGSIVSIYTAVHVMYVSTTSISVGNLKVTLS